MRYYSIAELFGENEKEIEEKLGKTENIEERMNIIFEKVSGSNRVMFVKKMNLGEAGLVLVPRIGDPMVPPQYHRQSPTSITFFFITNKNETSFCWSTKCRPNIAYEGGVWPVFECNLTKEALEIKVRYRNSMGFDSSCRFNIDDQYINLKEVDI